MSVYCTHDGNIIIIIIILHLQIIYQSRTKRTRRNFNLPIEAMKEALRLGGSKDENGVPCATATEIATYLAKKQNLDIDRSLRNAVYHRLRTGKEYEKREEKLSANQKREHKSYFYIRGSRRSSIGGTIPANTSNNLLPPVTPITNTITNNHDNVMSSIHKVITNEVPTFGGSEGHRCYFHK